MAIWSIKPKLRKSIFERVYLTKEKQELVIETCWRSGEFTLETEDENPPDIQSGVDIYNCEYSYELVETSDGSEYFEMSKCTEETKEWITNFLVDHSWLELENHGWMQIECEMIIDCDLLIERC
jgi:hypothetical protein